MTLHKLFYKINENLLSIISNRQNLGISTIKQRLFLKKISEQLNFMVNKSWELSNPTFAYLFRKSKLIKSLQQLDLNIEEAKIVERITENFMGNIIESSFTTYNYLKDMQNITKKELFDLSGSITEKDRFYKDLYVKNIEKNGIVGFIDKSNKKWTLGHYTDMVLRTSTKMTQNYGVLYTYEHIDLYKISSHNSLCPICRPLENRVYSRSGQNPNYPPLAKAFGKINSNGSNDLSNTYLNIHPNCQHSLIPFKEDFKSEKELEKIRKFSSFEDNPPNLDSRSKEQIEAYKKRERGRQQLINDFKEFQSMKLLLGNNIPKTFNTFQKHKQSNSQAYQNWQKSYKNK